MDISFLKAFLGNLAAIMLEQKEHLIQLDSVVGDGDLGLTMSDGFLAASHQAEQLTNPDAGLLLYQAGKAMSTAVPSTMGTLMASGLMQAGKALKGKLELTIDDLILMFSAYEEGVMHRGKAAIGDKTFLDGLDPAIHRMKASYLEKASLEELAKHAVEAAKLGYEQTAAMLALHGRAATRGEASRSLKDPGAYVAYLMMKAFYTTVQNHQ